MVGIMHRACSLVSVSKLHSSRLSLHVVLVSAQHISFQTTMVWFDDDF